MHVHAHHQHAHVLSVFSLLATVVKRFTNMSSGGRLNGELWREEEEEEKDKDEGYRKQKLHQGTRDGLLS